MCVEITSATARQMYDVRNRMYQQNVANGAKNPKLNMPQILEEIAADGELDEWYYYYPVPRVIRPLRVAP